MENANLPVNDNSERQHSLRWYQDKLNEKYNYYFKIISDKPENGVALISLQNNAWKLTGMLPIQENYKLYAHLVANQPYRFSTVFARVFCEEQNHQHRNLDKKTEQMQSEYHSCRIELLKEMNFIDLCCKKICDYNIDESVYFGQFNASNVRYALIWLLCDSCPPEELDAQDVNRWKAYLKLQLELYFVYKGEYYDCQKLEQEYTSVEREWQKHSTSGKVADINRLKDNLREILREIFEVYDLLLKYRTYLPDVDVIIDNDDYISIRNALLLVRTISKLFLERLISYSKIPDPNLGDSDFRNAYLTRSTIPHGNFVNSDFESAQLDSAIMPDCDFSICNFYKAVANDANFDDCTFNYSNMIGINLQNASCRRSLFDSVLLRDPRLDGDAGIELANQLKSAWENYVTEEQLFEDQITTRNNNKGNNNLRMQSVRLYKQLCKDTRDENYWSRTLANAETDNSPRLGLFENGQWQEITVKDSKDKEKRVMKTIFHDLFDEINNKFLSTLRAQCEAQIIDKALLNKIIEAVGETKCYPEYLCRIEKASLNGVTATDCLMHGLDFSHIDISNAAFNGSDLSDSKGFYTNAEMSAFARATMNGAFFFHSRFNDTDFSEARAINATFVDCKMSNINFSGASAIGIRVYCTKRDYPFLSYLLTKLETGDCKEFTEDINDKYEFDSKYTMYDSNWSNAYASKAEFVCLLMDRSHFTKTDLKNALLFNDVIRWSTFVDADASYALFIGDSFHQANFRNTNLSQSHSYACEFSGCQMVGVNYIGARLDKVNFYDDDLSGADFSHAWFENCIFRDCEFKNVNLSNVDFVNCVFSGVDFSTCRGLARAVFKDCAFVGWSIDNPKDLNKFGLFDNDDSTPRIIKLIPEQTNSPRLLYSGKSEHTMLDLFSMNEGK